MSLSQKLPDDSVIDLCCSLAAQGFVLAVTMVREAVDEMRRYRRDKEMNSQLYSKLTVRGQWGRNPSAMLVTVCWHYDNRYTSAQSISHRAISTQLSTGFTLVTEVIPLAVIALIFFPPLSFSRLYELRAIPLLNVW